MLIGALLQYGCASAPKDLVAGIRSEQPTQTIRDKSYARAQRYLDADAVLRARSLALPRVQVAEGAVAARYHRPAGGSGGQPCQSRVLRLAPYLRVDDDASDLEIG